MPGQLAQRPQVLERVGEGAESAVGQEAPEGGLDPGGLAQLLVTRSVGRELRGQVVRVAVGRDEVVDDRVRDLADGRRQVAHAVPVDRHAEADLGLDLVALGIGDVAHVVPEPGDAEPVGFVPGARGPAPGGDPVGDVRLTPVTGDGLAGDAQAGLEVAELAIAVGGLVEVHEVHVDLAPRQIAVVLRRAGGGAAWRAPGARRSTSGPARTYASRR